eukprot:CAMPEP_0172694230 /NCGR_PEP_ID=MMETSP1074-20121228/26538_1 /TAXON_ID=2916 /ORGANISM="Ceratium fusus, Strain PA161109" /LENGTH=193 /DNA_ID=CAMNT_0013514717 /DNA_START=179 /DNA_END=760 /DNA_ORIENTATION=-
MIWKYTSTAVTLTQQTVVAGLALAGIPIIFVAFWGVSNRVEVPIRLYGYYMVLCLLLDLVFIVDEFCISSPCVESPTMARKGTAFQCGAARIFEFITVMAFLSIGFYMTFVVFSYCEELAAGGSGPDLSDLAMVPSGHYKMKEGHFDHILSRLDMAEKTYGAMTIGGGSKTLFGRHHHMMEYPPPVAPAVRLQ